MKSKSSFRRLVSNIPEAIGIPILISDSEGRIIHANGAAQEKTGRSLKNLAGAALENIFDGVENFRKLIDEALKGKRILVIDCALKNRIGERVPLEHLEINSLTPRENDSSHAVISFREKEESIVEKIGDMSDRGSGSYDIVWRGIAHEVKNPLSGIKGAAQMLLKSVNETSPFIDHAKVILRETERINRFLDNLSESSGLAFSFPLEISKLLRETIELTSSYVSTQNKDITIKLLADPSLPGIEGDPDALFRAFTNILKNSVEAIEVKGVIRITLKLHEDLVLTTKSSGKNYLVEIDFFDNGKRISEEEEPLLFLPFFTNKPGGSGMGLYFAHNTILAHGGTIKLKRYHDGKAFRIYLPLRKE